MGPQEDYIETVLTCEGDYYDPEFHKQLQDFSDRLQDLLVTDKRKLIIKKVEPWNSVRVTFNIPKEAAVRLRALAEQGDHTLRELGVLAVQIDGDRVISLTIAGKNNEPTELVFHTAGSGPITAASRPVSVFENFDASSSDEIGIPGPGNVEATRKNIQRYLGQQGNTGENILGHLFNPNSSQANTVTDCKNSAVTVGHVADARPNVHHNAAPHFPFGSPSRSPSHSIGAPPSSSISNSSGPLNFPSRSPPGYPSPSQTHTLQSFPSPGSSRSQPSPSSSQLSPRYPTPPPPLQHLPPQHPGSPGVRLPPHGPTVSAAIQQQHQSVVSQGQLVPNFQLQFPQHHNNPQINNLRGVGANKDITSSSPLLVNLLQSDPAAHFNNLPQHKMPPPFDSGSPPKRKRKKRKKPVPNSNMEDDNAVPISAVENRVPQLGIDPHLTNSASPGGSCSQPSTPNITPPSSVHTHASRSPVRASPDKGNGLRHIINPYTGQLEPVDSDISDDSLHKVETNDSLDHSVQLQPPPNPLVAWEQRLAHDRLNDNSAQARDSLLVSHQGSPRFPTKHAAETSLPPPSRAPAHPQVVPISANSSQLPVSSNATPGTTVAPTNSNRGLFPSHSQDVRLQHPAVSEQHAPVLRKPYPPNRHEQFPINLRHIGHNRMDGPGPVASQVDFGANRMRQPNYPVIHPMMDPRVSHLDPGTGVPVRPTNSVSWPVQPNSAPHSQGHPATSSGLNPGLHPHRPRLPGSSIAEVSSERTTQERTSIQSQGNTQYQVSNVSTTQIKPSSTPSFPLSSVSTVAASQPALPWLPTTAVSSGVAKTSLTQALPQGPVANPGVLPNRAGSLPSVYRTSAPDNSPNKGLPISSSDTKLQDGTVSVCVTRVSASLVCTSASSATSDVCSTSAPVNPAGTVVISVSTGTVKSSSSDIKTVVSEGLLSVASSSHEHQQLVPSSTSTAVDANVAVTSSAEDTVHIENNQKCDLAPTAAPVRDSGASLNTSSVGESFQQHIVSTENVPVESKSPEKHEIVETSIAEPLPKEESTVVSKSVMSPELKLVSATVAATSCTSIEAGTKEVNMHKSDSATKLTTPVMSSPMLPSGASESAGVTSLGSNTDNNLNSSPNMDSQSSSAEDMETKDTPVEKVCSTSAPVSLGDEIVTSNEPSTSNSSPLVASQNSDRVNNNKSPQMEKHHELTLTVEAKTSSKSAENENEHTSVVLMNSHENTNGGDELPSPLDQTLPTDSSVPPVENTVDKAVKDNTSVSGSDLLLSSNGTITSEASPVSESTVTSGASQGPQGLSPFYNSIAGHENHDSEYSSHSFDEVSSRTIATASVIAEENHDSHLPSQSIEGGSSKDPTSQADNGPAKDNVEGANVITVGYALSEETPVSLASLGGIADKLLTPSLKAFDSVPFLAKSEEGNRDQVDISETSKGIPLAASLVENPVMNSKPSLLIKEVHLSSTVSAKPKTPPICKDDNHSELPKINLQDHLKWHDKTIIPTKYKEKCDLNPGGASKELTEGKGSNSVQFNGDGLDVKDPMEEVKVTPVITLQSSESTGSHIYESVEKESSIGQQTNTSDLKHKLIMEVPLDDTVHGLELPTSVSMDNILKPDRITCMELVHLHDSQEVPTDKEENLPDMTLTSITQDSEDNTDPSLCKKEESSAAEAGDNEDSENGVVPMQLTPVTPPVTTRPTTQPQGGQVHKQDASPQYGDTPPEGSNDGLPSTMDSSSEVSNAAAALPRTPETEFATPLRESNLNVECGAGSSITSSKEVFDVNVLSASTTCTKDVEHTSTDNIESMSVLDTEPQKNTVNLSKDDVKSNTDVNVSVSTSSTSSDKLKIGTSSVEERSVIVPKSVITSELLKDPLACASVVPSSHPGAEDKAIVKENISSTDQKQLPSEIKVSPPKKSVSKSDPVYIPSLPSYNEATKGLFTMSSTLDSLPKVTNTKYTIPSSSPKALNLTSSPLLKTPVSNAYINMAMVSSPEVTVSSVSPKKPLPSVIFPVLKQKVNFLETASSHRNSVATSEPKSTQNKIDFYPQKVSSHSVHAPNCVTSSITQKEPSVSAPLEKEKIPTSCTKFKPVPFTTDVINAVKSITSKSELTPTTVSTSSASSAASLVVTSPTSLAVVSSVSESTSVTSVLDTRMTTSISIRDVTSQDCAPQAATFPVLSIPESDSRIIVKCITPKEISHSSSLGSTSVTEASLGTLHVATTTSPLAKTVPPNANMVATTISPVKPLNVCLSTNKSDICKSDQRLSQSKGISILQPLYDREAEIEEDPDMGLIDNKISLQKHKESLKLKPEEVLQISKAGASLDSAMVQLLPHKGPSSTFTIAQLIDDTKPNPHRTDISAVMKSQKEGIVSCVSQGNTPTVMSLGQVKPVKTGPVKGQSSVKPHTTAGVIDFPRNSTLHLTNFVQKSIHTPSIVNSAPHPITSPRFPRNLTESVQKIMQAIPKDNPSPPPQPPKLNRPASSLGATKTIVLSPVKGSSAGSASGQPAETVVIVLPSASGSSGSPGNPISSSARGNTIQHSKSPREKPLVVHADRNTPISKVISPTSKPSPICALPSVTDIRARGTVVISHVKQENASHKSSSVVQASHYTVPLTLPEKNIPVETVSGPICNPHVEHNYISPIKQEPSSHVATIATSVLQSSNIHGTKHLKEESKPTSVVVQPALKNSSMKYSPEKLKETVPSIPKAISPKPTSNVVHVSKEMSVEKSSYHIKSLPSYAADNVESKPTTQVELSSPMIKQELEIEPKQSSTAIEISKANSPRPVSPIARSFSKSLVPLTDSKTVEEQHITHPARITRRSSRESTESLASNSDSIKTPSSQGRKKSLSECSDISTDLSSSVRSEHSEEREISPSVRSTRRRGRKKSSPDTTEDLLSDAAKVTRGSKRKLALEEAEEIGKKSRADDATTSQIPSMLEATDAGSKGLKAKGNKTNSKTATKTVEEKDKTSPKGRKTSSASKDGDLTDSFEDHNYSGTKRAKAKVIQGSAGRGAEDGGKNKDSSTVTASKGQTSSKRGSEKNPPLTPEVKGYGKGKDPEPEAVGAPTYKRATRSTRQKDHYELPPPPTKRRRSSRDLR